MKTNNTISPQFECQLKSFVFSVFKPIIYTIIGQFASSLKNSNTYQLGVLLSAQRKSVVSLVPLSEGRCVDLHNGALGQSFGTYQLVITWVVDDIDDSCLSGDA